MEKRIQHIASVFDKWLKPDNAELKAAIEQTVVEGLFSFEDIKHAILALKETVNETSLMNWVNQSGLKQEIPSTNRVLCLHAGNIPLVGFQDALSVVISGARYHGKLSKKDPHILPTFLKLLRDEGLLENGQWSTELTKFYNLRADAVLFAGSEISAEEVGEILTQNHCIKAEAPQLIRTAHYSIAIISDNKPETFRQLTEAAFRYGGQGCRSVAVVFAPFSLNSEKCSFTDYVESFWLTNPQHSKPQPSLYYRFAYNKGAEYEQSWLDDFLIEESALKPSEKFVLHWIEGDAKMAAEYISKHGDGLQTVYAVNPEQYQQDIPVHIEPLNTAQKPPINWEPDGICTLSWLSENLDVRK
jgi:hypothetical protein